MIVRSISRARSGFAPSRSARCGPSGSATTRHRPRGALENRPSARAIRQMGLFPTTGIAHLLLRSTDRPSTRTIFLKALESHPSHRRSADGTACSQARRDEPPAGRGHGRLWRSRGGYRHRTGGRRQDAPQTLSSRARQGPYQGDDKGRREPLSQSHGGGSRGGHRRHLLAEGGFDVPLHVPGSEHLLRGSHFNLFAEAGAVHGQKRFVPCVR